ncbi:MAG: microcin ABC transporter ATP-binding protein [Candidatus Rokubacteria bacterium GWC2_70_16]|nr:MAG: microcin ABC transporter ATP-binding protein [Candidatus Rokubacteria bacterium GWC2_70_16]OGL16133.1 MAG: microcin ABC transporter ATP-binding protein [Candidatus Rokubacteria bacterium RIFCSPLOWO2_12_FULL_71_19]
MRDLTVRLPRGADRENAIQDVSLEVRPQEILCLVGESGSGKSVTAYAVMGLLPRKQLVATAGSVRLQGEELLAASPARLRDLRGSRMSMIFQEPMTALNPVMTASDQIDEVLASHTGLTRPERQRRVLDVMASVRLPEPERLARAYPHQLSGGQRQRIMIAMALALEPALLIADEPTTALDVTTQAQILRLVKEIQREHRMGVLFITHDFGVVAEIADRVAVMREGEIVETGTTGQVLTEPQHPYTRMLIAAVPSIVPRAARPVTGAVVLETRSLTKVYAEKSFFRPVRTVRAVAEVSVTVRRGETLGVVGESGSGKSTLARCVMRLIEPTAGSIRLDDADIAGLPAAAFRAFRKRIQIVFQDPYRSLNPRRTAGQSIVEGPINYGVPSDEAWARARALMELVALDPRSIDRYPHQFSGGQRQRICIARALAMEPEVLVADEPVSALDVSVQAQVLELLADIRRRFDLAMLFITHDLRVAAQVCDTVAVMHEGRVVEYGPVGEVFSRPGHEYTRSLLDAAPGRGWTFGVAARAPA